MSSMFVVWKRPDGFHNAEPKDFKVIDIGDRARLWLHKKDEQWFPFRISGGWQEQEATQRLNRMVNLIGKPSSKWVQRLMHEFDHAMTDDSYTFYEETLKWLESLLLHLKGDTWELEIMAHAIKEVISRIRDCEKPFLRKASMQK